MRKAFTCFLVAVLCSFVSYAGPLDGGDGGVLSAGPKIKLSADNVYNPRFTKVTPNPARTDAEITFYNPTRDIHTLVVYNIIGNKIEAYQNNGSNTFGIDVSNFKAGVYFYVITNEKDNVATGRLIVRN